MKDWIFESKPEVVRFYMLSYSDFIENFDSLLV